MFEVHDEVIVHTKVMAKPPATTPPPTVPPSSGRAGAGHVEGWLRKNWRNIGIAVCAMLVAGGVVYLLGKR